MYKFLPICLTLAAGVSAYPRGGWNNGGNWNYQGTTTTTAATTTAATTTAATTTAATTTPAATATQAPISSTDYLSTFDDIDGTGLGPAAAIGPYNGLVWSNIGVASGEGLLGDTVRPVSPDTVAQSLDSQDMSISTQYQGSATDIFDLYSLYVACGEDGILGLLGGARSCAITISGYRASVEVARQQVQYTAPTDNGLLSLNLGGDGSNFRFVPLDDTFRGLDTVRIFSRTVEPVDIYLDNVRYTVYNPQIASN